VTSASGGSIKDQLAKLDPEERAHQGCVIKGLEAIKHDKKLPGADRLKTSIFSAAVFKLKFNCTVTADQMKATVFTYERRTGGRISACGSDVQRESAAAAK
jgi:hypothetical protein